jgi:hypothetical protein
MNPFPELRKNFGEASWDRRSGTSRGFATEGIKAGGGSGS